MNKITKINKLKDRKWEVEVSDVGECLVLKAMKECKCKDCEYRRKLEALNFLMRNQLEFQQMMYDIFKENK